MKLRVILKNILLLLSLSFFSVMSYADINSDMNSFFKSLGTDVNVTDPSAYKGQEAGFYTGGSLYSRNSVRDFQIAHIDLPSFRAGCGGIDMFLGGFSFINDQQFEQMLKNIMSNATGYAFELAMESTTPEIANTFSRIQDIMQKINNSDINTCTTAASIVGSMWPRTQVAQQNVCETIGQGGGIFSDYAAAHQGCGTGGQMDSVLDKAETDPNLSQFKNLALTQGNLAWKAMKKIGFLANDTSLAEFFMSVSGSVLITQKDANTNQASYLDSLIENQQKTLIKSLLYGGTITVYQCDTTDENGCLHPGKTSVQISPNSGFAAQVKALLDDMASKIGSDTPLNQAEIGLLQNTGLPVMKMLDVQKAYTKDNSILDVSNYADLIAIDILFQYLNEMLEVVQEGAEQLQYPPDTLEKFQKNLELAKNSLRVAQKTAYQEVMNDAQLIEQTQTIERALAGRFSSEFSDSLNWADGMQ